jgi:hypothetical protein
MKKLLFLIGLASLTMNAQVPSYVPTNGLVAYYPFNGNANDVSGNANNGTNNGATLTTDRFGNANSAYSFNGINNFISTNTSSILFPNGITFCAWINPTVYKNASIVDKMLDSGSGFRINTRENSISPGLTPKKIWSQCTYYGQASVSCSTVSTTDQNLNNWQFIVGTFGSDGKLKLYYNGLLENQITTSYNVSNNSPILIGRGSTSITYENFQGYIDDVGVWNRALTIDEITNLYNTNLCYQSAFIINTGVLSYNPPTYNNTITIYPNPANDHITVDCGTIANVVGYHIEIVNSLGQVVFNQPMNTQQYNVALNSWTGQGIYFVKVYDAGNTLLTTRKLILQ